MSETVTVPLPCCPHCHGPVTDLQVREQLIEELPPITPVCKRLRTYEGHCARCGRVRSRHPEQGSLATGAAGVQLGPRATAWAVTLRHGQGLTMRRTCILLREQLGLTLSAGGLSQLLARVAQRLQPQYEQLRRELQQSQSLHVDETSWWLAGQGGWLWTLTTTTATLYHVSGKRDAATLATILGPEYAGVLVSDCLNVYDRYPAAAKSKCVAHHLRAIREALAVVPESRFLQQLRRLLKAALRLQRWAARLPEPVYARGVASLERRLDQLLAAPGTKPEERRLAARLQKRRGAIFTFLHQPEVAATNNQAERQLRPAVITRKLSCGNKTAEGARNWEVLASLAATCRQRGESFFDLVLQHLGPSERQGSGLSPPAPQPSR